MSFHRIYRVYKQFINFVCSPLDIVMESLACYPWDWCTGAKLVKSLEFDLINTENPGAFSEIDL